MIDRYAFGNYNQVCSPFNAYHTKYQFNINVSPFFFLRSFSGKPLAVHTPPKKITTCEILPKGKYITLALVNEPNLVTLELKNRNTVNQQSSGAVVDADTENPNTPTIYGDEENNGKIFQL